MSADFGPITGIANVSYRRAPKESNHHGWRPVRRVHGMKALLTIGSLGPGGAERILAAVAGKLAERGTHVTVLTFSQPSSDFYKVAPAVNRKSPTYTKSRILRLLQFQAALFNAARESDILVGFLTETNMAVCLTGLLLRKPVVVSERIHPTFNSRGRRRILFFLALKLYRLSNVRLVVQSKSIADAFRNARLEASVAPNGVHIPDQVTSWELRPNNVIVVGSLSTRKRVSDALEAWAASGLGDINWRLTIVGDGPLRLTLQSLACLLKIEHSVDFVGSSPNVPQFLDGSKVYVSCSDHEGTSNALLEAMAYGCACVVSDCPGDNRSLMKDGQGIVFPVGDVGALARQLEWLAANKAAGAALGLRAQAAATKRDWDDSLQIWSNLIESTSPTREAFPT